MMLLQMSVKFEMHDIIFKDETWTALGDGLRPSEAFGTASMSERLTLFFECERSGVLIPGRATEPGPALQTVCDRFNIHGSNLFCPRARAGAKGEGQALHFGSLPPPLLLTIHITNKQHYNLTNTFLTNHVFN